MTKQKKLRAGLKVKVTKGFHKGEVGVLESKERHDSLFDFIFGTKSYLYWIRFSDFVPDIGCVYRNQFEVL